MFSFGNFLTKNAITFDLTEIEKKRYLVCVKFVAHPILPPKMSKSQKKKLFSKSIFNKIAIFKKSTDLKKYILSDSGGSSRHFDYLFTE